MAKLNYDIASSVLDYLAKSQGILDSPTSSIDELLPLSPGVKLTCYRSTIRKEDKFEDLVDMAAAGSQCGGLLRTTVYRDPFAHIAIDTDPHISFAATANAEDKIEISAGGECQDLSNNIHE